MFAIKRFHQPDWGDNWRRHFGVDVVNGSPGHRTQTARPARSSARTCASVLPTTSTGGRSNCGRTSPPPSKCRPKTTSRPRSSFPADTSRRSRNSRRSIPIARTSSSENCEYRLFQRPDDAIHRGFDKQAEADLARHDVNFVSNFEPLTREQVDDMLEKVVDFDAFTEPMQKLLRSVSKAEAGYIVCSDNPRRIDGVPSKNPRYLQDRPDLVSPIDRYLAEMGTRLFRATPADQPVRLPVNAVLGGRRLNPPDPAAGIRGLAVYGPIHYQELPELFMDYIASLTGKSPSTTGAGSEGALTKGPFNMLRPAADLNAALVSMILTGLDGFTTAAGLIGPDFRADHDISLLVPEDLVPPVAGGTRRPPSHRRGDAGAGPRRYRGRRNGPAGTAWDIASPSGLFRTTSDACSTTPAKCSTRRSSAGDTGCRPRSSTASNTFAKPISESPGPTSTTARSTNSVRRCRLW